MKKIAIPMASGSLCAHFGHCEKFAIVETEGNKIISKKEITPPSHEPGLLPKWLSDMGVTNIIAGGMGSRAIDLFNEQNIKVVVGAKPKTSDELVNDFLLDILEKDNNSCDH